MTDTEKTALLTRIELIEEELAQLKAKLAEGNPPVSIRLEGLWSDIDVTEEDIEEAKRSLFREVNDF